MASHEFGVIEIEQVKLETKIGVLAWEREMKQTLIADVRLGILSDRVFASDDLSDAINYAQVVASLRDFAQTRSFRLLETFAHEAATMLHEQFGAKDIEIYVRKPALIEGVGSLGVRVRRQFGGAQK
ncbi:MAG: dihydroneopterin aldolase [Burkholderiales bacterium]|jgi:dihydroneopterin aldolase|nr:dihydroneopterin aldolase [Burkholderiales bacterium]